MALQRLVEALREGAKEVKKSGAGKEGKKDRKRKTEEEGKEPKRRKVKKDEQ